MFADLSESVDFHCVDPNHVGLNTSPYQRTLSLPVVRSLLAITSGPWDPSLYSESEVKLFNAEHSTYFAESRTLISPFTMSRRQTASTVFSLDRPMEDKSQSTPSGYFP